MIPGLPGSGDNDDDDDDNDDAFSGAGRSQEERQLLELKRFGG